MLKIKLTEQELNDLFLRGARTTISKQGTREVQLNNEDTLALFNHPLYEVTLVPRRNLTANAIEKRFGVPDQVVEDTENQMATWFFLDKGLELILIEGGNDILRYRLFEDN